MITILINKNTINLVFLTDNDPFFFNYTKTEWRKTNSLNFRYFLL